MNTPSLIGDNKRGPMPQSRIYDADPLDGAVGPTPNAFIIPKPDDM